MQIRTLAQYIMIAYTVGISLALSRSGSPGQDFHQYQDFHQILAGAGLVVSLFALVLGMLNQHYSTAFSAIRDQCLVKLEDKKFPNYKLDAKPEKLVEVIGPWQAHQYLRKRQRPMRWVSWHLPFIVLGCLGAAGVIIGLRIWP